MSEKIFSFNGGPVAGVPEPVEDVVSVLEEYLVRARSGELVGVVVVGRHVNEDTSWSRGGRTGRDVVGAGHEALTALSVMSLEDE